MVHEPSGAAFDSTTQLAGFHRGWTAGRDADAEGQVMQQPLVGCAFCNAPIGIETGEAHTWGQDERVTHPICVDCATQTEPDPDERDHVACDGCGLVVDTPAALTRFRIELGHLEGSIQVCARCSLGGPATYWTRDLEAHIVTD